jgi:hypothetical protein
MVDSSSVVLLDRKFVCNRFVSWGWKKGLKLYYLPLFFLGDIIDSSIYFGYFYTLNILHTFDKSLHESISPLFSCLSTADFSNTGGAQIAIDAIIDSQTSHACFWCIEINGLKIAPISNIFILLELACSHANLLFIIASFLFVWLDLRIFNQRTILSAAHSRVK